jgi:hypothetical protein
MADLAIQLYLDVQKVVKVGEHPARRLQLLAADSG